MATKIKKRGKILWLGRKQKSGSRLSKVFKTKTEALAWETAMEDADWTTATGCLSLGEWGNRYLDFAESKFVFKTYQEKRTALRLLFETIDHTLLVSRLTPALVLAHLQKQAEKRSGYAANKDRKNLGAAYNWGMKYLEMPAPNHFLEVDKWPEKRTPRYVPPEEDFWAVYDQAVGQDQVMLAVAVYTAARRNEIFKLIWQDIDFKQNRICLTTRKRVGGSEDRVLLPMAEDLRERLSWWWGNRPFKDSPYVFLCDDQTPFCKDYFGRPFTVRQHWLGRECEKAGVEPFGFHSIRHLTATILYNKGVKVADIQFILRHKSPSTTERYLKSLGLEAARPALEQIRKNDY